MRKNDLEAKNRLFALTEKDMIIPWFEEVINEKVLRIFQSVLLGLHDDTFSRCTEASQVLDFTLEGHPGGEPLKLTYAYNHDSKLLGDLLKDQKCIEFLGALRNNRNHYNYKQNKNKIFKRFNDPTDSQMEAWVKDGAERIGKALEIKSLPAIIENIISNG